VYRDRYAFDEHERQPHVRRFLNEREQYLAGPLEWSSWLRRWARDCPRDVSLTRWLASRRSASGSQFIASGEGCLRPNWPVWSAGPVTISPR
jgi:hypothetical protein